MKRKFIFLSILIFTSLACQTVMSVIEPTAQPTAAPLLTQPEPVQQPQGSLPPLTEDQVPRIPVSEAKAAVDSGAAILVDVRSVEAYKNGHAAGAISIPLEKFEYSIQNLSFEKQQWIITYCT
jgi:3-mercaptopyruvate sulfurtransferase SseA